MNPQPQPTVYSGVRFRSRLEACWAHLFDQIGMDWQYEPTRLLGWIPDFRLDHRWLVEVKPVPPVGAHMLLTTGLKGEQFAGFKKALRYKPTMLLGDGPGENFGAIVRVLPDGDILAQTFLYDPAERGLIRMISGDGWGDPQVGALWPHWRRARAAFRPLGYLSPSERRRAGVPAAKKAF